MRQVREFVVHGVVPALVWGTVGILIACGGVEAVERLAFR